MGKSVTQILGDLSGKSFSDFNYEGLEKTYAASIRRQASADAQLENAHYNRPGTDLRSRQASAQSKGMIMMARQKAIKAQQAEQRELDSHMPIATVFETYQSTKQAFDMDRRDVGLSTMASHLEKVWKRDRSASINAHDFANLKEHYARNYPKSAAASVLEGVAEAGYSDLPKAELMRIASSIRSQEDYDYMMKQHGLTSNSPRNKKARGFILSLLTEG